VTAASLILKGERALERCLRAVARDPDATVLFCDIDGTISPIAQTPWEATVPAEFRELLKALVERLGLVAFVTGRDLDGGLRMVNVPGAVYVGTHGLDMLDARGRRTIDPGAEEWLPTVREMIDLARGAELQPMGVLIEDKGAAFAVHYRLAEDREAAEAAVVRKIVEPARARGLWVISGYLAYDLRPPVAVNKGTATERLLASGDYRTALFLGDDLTDCNGFDAVHRWAAASSPAPQAETARATTQSGEAARARRIRPEPPTCSRTGLAAAALTDETWKEVKAAADVWVAATPGMFEVLSRLLRAATD
jgi:trehalose 6-phosphate phosphatase